jgi:4-alpha-glucanotransferase
MPNAERPAAAPPSPGGPLFSWLQDRGAGVLLHPTSFPGNQGIGTLDTAAERFLEFLAAAGLRHWQICPLGPTGFGDSPYQCFSAFAGNPYLIDLEALVTAGLLDSADLRPLRALPADRIDFGALYHLKWPLLHAAHARLSAGKGREPYGSFADFKRLHAEWLAPYTLFRALKDHHQGQPWWDWPAALRTHAGAAASPIARTLATAIDAHAFTQYLFFGQWSQVRAAAARRGITIIGDLPIFVARDSADVWADPNLFELDPQTAQPLAVAGVPPDYFSAEGQLWGNPLYRWEHHAADGFAWWMRRLRTAFAQHDVVRIDHFRAFDEYWRIPFPATTARHGTWKPGPGRRFFEQVRTTFPDARIIAEDLGELTPSVIRLREETGLPGMAILQFAFGCGSDNSYLPHQLSRNSVLYPGTHDNDTTRGWYASAPEAARDHARRYLEVNGTEISWDFIRAAYRSVSRLAVLPLQDLLSLDSRARMNTPGKPEGNWQWRYRSAQLASLGGDTTAYLRRIGELYGR